MQAGFAATVEARAAGLPVGRIVATAAACAAFLYARHVPVPMVNLAQFADDGISSAVSIAMLGLVPILQAYVLVEIASFLVPRWRPLRQVPGRPALERASTWLAVLLALVQGFGVARYLETVQVGYGFLVTDPGTDFRIVLTLTLAAGCCLALALARFIDRHGVGRGMSMLLAAGGVQSLPQLAVRFQRDELGSAEAMGILVAVGGSMLVLGSRRGPLRLPVCGLDPVLRASTYAVALVFSGVLPRLAPALASAAGLWVLRMALVVALTLSLSRVFAAGDDARRRAALPGAVARSLVYLIGMSVVLVEVPAVDLLGLVTAAAVAMDLFLELRLRAAHGELVAIRREQAPDHADDLVAALRERGIPAVPQAAFHRTLLHFFGPFVPVDVLVPAVRAQEAIEAIA